MASIAVTQAAFAGFGVLRRKPWAPLVWSLAYVMVVATLVLLLGAAFVTSLGRLMTLGPKASPADVLGLLGAVVGGYVYGMVYSLLSLWLPQSLLDYREAFMFLIVILILVFRPSGLIRGNTTPERVG